MTLLTAAAVLAAAVLVDPDWLQLLHHQARFRLDWSGIAIKLYTELASGAYIYNRS